MTTRSKAFQEVFAYGGTAELTRRSGLAYFLLCTESYEGPAGAPGSAGARRPGRPVTL
jgi:hypothetical protein